MIPNFEAFCLEFIAMVDIEKGLHFHGLMIMGESEPFTSKGSLVKSEKKKNFWKPRNLLSWVCQKHKLPCQSLGEWRRERSFLAILLHPAVKTRGPLS